MSPRELEKLRMLQVTQSLRNGTTKLVDSPSPSATRGHLLIRTSRSLISPGTERMLIDFGKANWIQKARQQPDKVKQVLQKMKTDGVASTLEAVHSKLDQDIPLGYCNVGTVLEVGEGVTGFEVGDRVVSNGNHAEVVCVPKNLCAKVPNDVTDDEAAFAVLGAIALQGIRLAEPTLGERFAVFGLGLIGLLTVQLLRANGCQVLAIDFNEERLKLAEQFGAQTVNLGREQDPIAAADDFTSGQGIDGVLITAATRSNEPVSQAAQMSRKRGRIVLVGVVGLELSRDDFYEKELSFQVSCSYGPGRYDESYESQGNDYPLPFVRWTEQRNFEAILAALASNQLEVTPFITHRNAFSDALDAYREISEGSQSLGILLTYPKSSTTNEDLLRRTIPIRSSAAPQPIDQPGLALIGSGGFATRFLAPAMKATGGRLEMVASRGGLSGVQAARKFGFQEATTDVDAVLSNDAVNAVVIATRHDTHAAFVCRALEAGKHVFVEKPLALDREQLKLVENAYEAAGDQLLMVGFNRRFAPHVVKMREQLSKSDAPSVFTMTVNAGAIPADHWTQDRAVGGGRIIGEACHFVDLIRFLADSEIVATSAVGLTSATNQAPCDSVAIQLSFANGSIGTLQYLANGHRSVAKERLEVFQSGRILQLDNFRSLRGHGYAKFRKMTSRKQDKGHCAEIGAFVNALRAGGPSPIPADELFEVTRSTFDIADALEGTSVDTVPEPQLLAKSA